MTAMLQRLPIAIQIVVQFDLDGGTWYCWQAANHNGKSQDFVHAVEHALQSVFAFLAEDAGYTSDDFWSINHPTI